VPESLSPERRAPFRWASANAWGALSMLRSRPGLMGLALVVFLGQFAAMSFNSVFQFYTHYRFGWGPAQIATLLMVLGGGSIVVQSFAAGTSARLLGERGAVLAGIAICVLGYAALGLAPSAPLFWAGTGLIIVAGIYGPSAQSMMSDRVGVDEQGRLQGALSIFFGLTSLAGPVIFTNAFAWSIGPGQALGVPAGLAFLIGAALLVAAFAMAMVFARPGAAAA
jgi:DHA1 family tetracycline resistance protein-like MFS transporter